MRRTQAQIIAKLEAGGWRVIKRWPDGTVNMISPEPDELDRQMVPVAPDGRCAGFATLEEALEQ